MSTETKTAHQHETYRSRGPLPFEACVAGRECNPASHGGATYVDVCLCGAERRRNSSGCGHHEAGLWTTVRHVAYDRITEWCGPVRSTRLDAIQDARRHNDGCRSQGGYGSADAFRVDSDGYITDDSERPVWPASGRTHGAARVTA